MTEGLIQIDDHISYKIYDKKQLRTAAGSQQVLDELRPGPNVTLYPIGSADKEVCNGKLPYIKNLGVDFTTSIVIFRVEYPPGTDI